MKIALAQLNPIVGDITGNLNRVIDILHKYGSSSDLLCFPELYLVGYPPRDLLEKKWFIKRVLMAIQELVDISKNFPETGLLLGTPTLTGHNTGKGLYNSAILIYQGKILIEQHKSLLPTYDVFDERRYFDPASDVGVINFKDEILGISICEDAWNDPKLWSKKIYTFDPIEALAKKGSTIFINISASPFHVGKEKIRYRLIQDHAKRHRVPFLFVNQVGGNDELIFDGRSMFIDRSGSSIEIFRSFEEEVKTIDTQARGTVDIYHPQDEIESIHNALVLGIRDYMKKCGFSCAIVGLSGGIDSAVTCCLAVEAVGSKNILGVSMPSPYSSKGSVEDSRKLARNLGIQFEVIPISYIYHSYVRSLQEHLQIKGIDTTMENIQARIRGNILMAFSNEMGYLLLSTGNKSEIAVGYCTLYGDMSGGLSVISDVPKTMVYKLARYINKRSAVIPEEIITKAPSAELKPNQMDQDSLPPYDILDQILYYYIEEGYSQEEIVALNFDPGTVKWVIQAVNRNEYKRRQSAPGLKVTTKAFGMGRRMPIAAKYQS